MVAIKTVFPVLLALLVINSAVAGQKTEKFDIITYEVPAGWQKEVNDSAVQLATEDSDGGICMITLFKSVPGSNDSKANFAASWETIVREIVTVSGAPRMQPSTSENGWTAENGFAQYESDGKKGLVMLITITGSGKMINIIALTNTGVYQQHISSFLESIILPGAEEKESPSHTNSPDQKGIAGKNDFRFSTTNFDDGWTATEQDDFVKVTKGNTVVLLHYRVPDIRRFNNLDESTAYVWNTLVAPRYRNASNVWMRRSWYADGDFMNGKYFGEANVIDNTTGEKLHVALYKNGNAGKWIEIITSDKSSFQNQFGIVYEQDGTNWDRLSALATYNKFAVAQEDLIGRWYSASGSNIQYYEVYTGNNAGMAFSSSNTEINFQSNGGYKSVYKGVDNTQNGGGNRYVGETFNGKFSVTNWEVVMTNRFKGATEKFSAQFEAVKGGRILLLTDRNQTTLSLAKQK